MIEPLEPTRRSEPVWLEPYPDILLEGLENTLAGSDVRYEMREAVGLAFVTALQHLPPRQRAVLVLREVLGFRAGEVAAMLDTSEASVKAALQRARATLKARLPAGGRERAPLPRSQREREVVGRFADAVERGDIDRIVSLLTSDAWLTMPPYPFEYQAARQSPNSFTTVRACAVLPSGSCPRGPTGSQRSAVTSRKHRQRSRALTG